MSCKVSQRTGVRVEDPVLSFTTGLQVVLQEADVKAVLLLGDRLSKKIAIKAAAKHNKNAYAVSLRAKHSGGIRASAFLNFIGWKSSQRVTLPAGNYGTVRACGASREWKAERKKEACLAIGQKGVLKTHTAFWSPD